MLDTNAYLSVMNQKREENLPNTTNKKENEETDMDSKVEWDCGNERRLFYAMQGLKPVGVNRHFMMICIHQRFSNVLGKDISSKVIWDHLESLYDMAVLHESEILPFPNKEVDYDLPVYCYDEAKHMYGNLADDSDDVNDDDSLDSKSELIGKSTKKQSLSKTKQNGSAVSNSKNTFLTPSGTKSSKPSTKKSDTKSSSTPDKAKPESSFPSKASKVKRSSSPFTAKNSRSELSLSTADDSSEPASKKIKMDNTTPVSSKKTSKTEVINSSKKTAKQEITSGSKQNKAETASSGKKIRNDKDIVNKKNETPIVNDTSRSRKSLKSDSKKSDQETPKRVTELPTSKQKTDRASSVSSRGSKHEDSDSSVISGSRKSSPAIKGDVNDKKKKTPLKRRRT